MPKALVTDYVSPILIDGLKERGYEVEYDQAVTLDILPNIIEEYDGIVINSKIIMDKSMIDLAPNLKFICRLGSGLEIIDLNYAKQKGIEVINTPTGNNNAVAEHAMGMLLSLSNNLLRADKEVRQLQWNREKNRGWELRGKTIGIIGFGHTGSQFAKKLSSWELRIISYDKYREHYGSEWSFIDRVAQEDILNQSDVISLHLPLTRETHHLVDKDFIAACKDDVVIINTSRGKVVDTEALLYGLDSGKIKGACLDVFENEKPHTFSKREYETYTRLYEKDNVVLSPHVAGWTHESLARIANVMLKKLDNSKIVF